ncbi:hypothetical protein KFE94_12840 [bacterium SCSIO 12643]|nr:hypothetical protein KFE94_12840 [bacterium SCSIO 12643]
MKLKSIYFIVFAFWGLSLNSCKKSIPEPAPGNNGQQNKLLGYWHNYDHFTYQSVLDTLFSDTNQFIMMDLDITGIDQLTKYYRDGSDPSLHSYDTATSRMHIWSGSFKVTYKMELFGSDSMTLSSLSKPAGGIPFPGSDKEVWVFVKK